MHTELTNQGEPVTAKAIKNRLFANSRPGKTLIEAFEYHNRLQKEKVGIGVAPATAQRYRTAYSHVRDFLQFFYQKKEIYLKELDHNFITEFEHYLKTIKEIGHNTTIKYIQNLKKIIHTSIDNGWLDKDPFRQFKTRLKTPERVFLSEKELKKIEEKEIGIPRLEEIRDVFVFCCYTGLAFSDVKKLSPEAVLVSNKGDKFISTRRKKTQSKATAAISNMKIIRVLFGIKQPNQRRVL